MNTNMMSRELSNISKEVRENIKYYVQKVPYGLYVGYAFILLLISLLLFGVYNWHVVRTAQAAQVALSESLLEYRAMKNGQKEANWPQVIEKATQKYAAYKNSSIAPYFLLLKTDAYLELGEYDQALQSMKLVVDATRSNALSSAHQLKYGLMQLDSSDETVAQAGKDLLLKLTADIKNPFRETALYYVGRYFFLHDDFAQAKKMWQELVDTQRMEQTAVTAWVQLAQQQVEQLP